MNLEDVDLDPDAISTLSLLSAGMDAFYGEQCPDCAAKYRVEYIGGAFIAIREHEETCPG